MATLERKSTRRSRRIRRPLPAPREIDNGGLIKAFDAVTAGGLWCRIGDAMAGPRRAGVFDVWRVWCQDFWRWRMAMFSGRLIFAIMLAALCPGGRAAHAQVAPVSYWTPGWPLGFGGNGAAGESSNTYGNFPGFELRDAGGGFGYARYSFPNGWFVGSERGGVGLSMNGINQFGVFGNSLYSEGVQFGYSLQRSSGLPVTLYAGFDTLKYNAGIGSPFAPFDSMSGTLPGYSAHAGVEFQPTSNVSLSLGFGFTQQSGRPDSDINSAVLPGAYQFSYGGRR
jgi:opacity protein-like surface antigen